MAFTQEAFDRYMALKAQLESQYGSDWMKPMQMSDGTFASPYSTMDNPYVRPVPLEQRGFNPANPSRSVLTYVDDPGISSSGLAGIDPETGERLAMPNIQGWDVNAYGDLSQWRPTDKLPNGQTVAEHVAQLQAFDWPEYASKPTGGTFGSFLKDALSSPGIAIPLGAAALGSAFGPGGFFSGSPTFAGANLPWTSGFDLAGGGALEGMGGFGSGEMFASAGDFGGDMFDFDLGDFFNSWDSQASFGGGTNITDFASGLSEGGALASDAGFVPGSFDLGQGIFPGGLDGAGMFKQLTDLGMSPQNAMRAITQQFGGSGGQQGTALSRLLGINPDLASLLGTLGATGLGMFTANRQTDQLKALADEYKAFGAPSRARYEGSFAPGFSMLNEPGYKDALDSTSTSLLHRLSATGGNPFGNPGGLIEANKQINSSLALPALQNYRNQNASTGGYGAFNTAAPGAATAAIGSSGDALTTLAGGLSDVLNPKPKAMTLADLMRQYNSNGFSLQ